jgi:hypothetical protein
VPGASNLNTLLLSLRSCFVFVNILTGCVLVCRYGPDAKAYKTAKKRRDSTTATVSQLAALLPLPKGTNKEKLKTNHILRLAVNFIRMKHLVQNNIMHHVASRSGSVTSDDGIATSPYQSSPPSKKKKTSIVLPQLPSEDVLNVWLTITVT